MRPQNWPALLDDYIDAARDTPFAWGSHDCVSFACGWHRILTGIDRFEAFRGRYANETEAVKLMLSNEVRGIESAGRYLFGEPVMSPSFVQRGSIVYGQGALGIWCGASGAFLTKDGMTFLRVGVVEAFWRI